jgi:hypothetical protein
MLLHFFKYHGSLTGKCSRQGGHGYRVSDETTGTLIRKLALNVPAGNIVPEVTAPELAVPLVDTDSDSESTLAVCAQFSKS